MFPPEKMKQTRGCTVPAIGGWTRCCQSTQPRGASTGGRGRRRGQAAADTCGSSRCQQNSRWSSTGARCCCCCSLALWRWCPSQFNAQAAATTSQLLPPLATTVINQSHPLQQNTTDGGGGRNSFCSMCCSNALFCHVIPPNSLRGSPPVATTALKILHPPPKKLMWPHNGVVRPFACMWTVALAC